MIWILLGVALSLILYKILKPNKYWADRGVPYSKPIPFLGTNVGFLFKKKSFPEMGEEIYNSFPKARYVGMIQIMEPILFIRDPELIKLITVKDFDHFVDHRTFIKGDAEPLWTRNLLSLKGDNWKDMRATLSPSFTGSKIRMMHTLVSNCADKYLQSLGNSDKGETYEMKDVFTRFANDVIASTAFGIEVDSWNEKDNEFYQMGKEATNLNGFWNKTNFMMLLLAPTLSRVLGLRMFSKKVSKFFTDLVVGNIRAREENGIVRQDMIHLLMEARKGNNKHDDRDELDASFATATESHIGKSTGHKKLDLSDVDVTAQALIFFFAGFDSISTMMSFLAYELALNPEIQEKLRKEIDETLKANNGKVNYEVLMNMKYMDMVISESLRKWPVSVMTDRKCVKKYTIEPTSPDEKPVTLEEGATLWIPVYPLQRDPEYWPEPERFDPERFNDENKESINPYTYLPFGIGPRNCIGSRFALMEVKTLFFKLLSKLEISVCKETPIPMKLSRDSPMITADPGFFLQLKPRSDTNLGIVDGSRRNCWKPPVLNN